MARTLSPRVGDFVAISLSGLCMAHCLALPLAAALLPITGVWAEAEWVHWAFALTAAPISLWTLTRRPRVAPLMLAVAGLCLLFSGAAGFPSHALETPITVTGSLFLVAAHVANWRRRPHGCD